MAKTAGWRAFDCENTLRNDDKPVLHPRAAASQAQCGVEGGIHPSECTFLLAIR